MTIDELIATAAPILERDADHTVLRHVKLSECGAATLIGIAVGPTDRVPRLPAFVEFDHLVSRELRHLLTAQSGVGIQQRKFRCQSRC